MSAELRLAAKANDLATLERLLDAGEDIDERSRDGWSALDLAARWQRVEAVRFLLERGAGVEKEDDRGQRVLSLARGHAEIAALLVERGARGVSGNRWFLSGGEDTRNIPQDAPAPVPMSRTDEYAVYDAVAEADNFRRDRLVVFERMTIDPVRGCCHTTDADPVEEFTWFFRYPWRKHWRGVAGIVQDFLDRNASPVRLEHRFRTPGGFRFEDQPRRPEEGESRGVFGLSRPGFNRDGSLAMVYLEWYGGPLAASGSLLLLTRSGSEWLQAETVDIWIS